MLLGKELCWDWKLQKNIRENKCETVSSLKSQNTNSAVQEPLVSDAQPSHTRQPAKLAGEKATSPARAYNSHVSHTKATASGKAQGLSDVLVGWLVI